MGREEDYLEVPKDLRAIASFILKSLEKIRKYGDLSQKTHNYFVVKGPTFARF